MIVTWTWTFRPLSGWRMLAKGYLFGSHFLPHDALATQKSGRTFLNELKEAGLANCKAVPRANDIWVGINKLRDLRGSVSASGNASGVGSRSNYHTIRETSSGLAKDEPCHDWSSHAADSARLISEAQAAGMLSRAGTTAGSVARHGGVRVRTGYRGEDNSYEQSSILDRFFGKPGRNVRVIR